MTSSITTRSDPAGPVHQALELLDETRGRRVTNQDLERIQDIAGRQLRQLAERGEQRATEAMDVELQSALTPAENVLGLPPPTPDPMRPGFEVEREETRIVLEVARLLRTRAAEQQQSANQRMTTGVAVAAVLVALVMGIVQIIVAMIKS